MKFRIGALALLMAMTAGAASAHSPYLLPNFFDATDRDHVTVQAGFTEAFFQPEVVMKADDYHVIGPDGAKTKITPTYFQDVTVFETATPANGTYRITTGTRAGRVSKAHLVKGEWEFLEPGKPAPADAVDMQSITRAEVFVSRGAPNDAALAPIGKGIEFHPITHPSSIFVGQDARFEVLLDGKPLANQVIELHHADEVYVDNVKGETVKADAKGQFTLKLKDPGVYQIMTRHRIDGGPTGVSQSLTYALTLEAVR
jgi:uncharacterized GH25 family protein